MCSELQIERHRTLLTSIEKANFNHRRAIDIHVSNKELFNMIHINRPTFNSRISLEVDDVSSLDHPLLRLAFDLKHLVLGQHESAHYGKPAIS